MKFFPGIKSCYRSTTDELATVTPHNEPFSSTSATYSSARGGKHESASHWRPALSIISEDAVLAPPPPRDNKKSSNERKTKTTTATTRAHLRSFSDQYGNSGMAAVVVPAFSPTPFVF